MPEDDGEEMWQRSVGEMEWMPHGFERYTARCTAYFWMVLQTVALYLLASFGRSRSNIGGAVQIHERTAGRGPAK